ncbi:hypothetical protein [Falsiroseomonas stagni]|uniref:Uncharacterized protein n=1 Tax=Falsiroseomonas stagni DSM 19981 TaxID=1123062 RepID=A0A1I4F787_9PROT|nr:hypothetical protein [Falsiroseomonas stagni]SFL13150.1 hypothetical protein SAMN02745775_12329 [Falsiroseomonas stagni DSM 19981]
MRKILSALAIAGALAAGAAPAHAQSRMGDNNNITARGEVRNQIALALGNRAHAHNVTGGMMVGSDFEMGSRNTLSFEGRARNQIALALGSRSAATNVVGGVLVTGRR